MTCPDEIVPLKQKIPRINLRTEAIPGKYTEIYITGINSPSKFFLVLRKNRLSLGQLTYDLHQFYGKYGDTYKVPDEFLVKGLYCAVLFEKVAWHRVQIRAVSGSDVVLYHIDFGNRSIMNKDEIRFLHQDFSTLPALSIKGSLANILPPDQENQWSQKAVSRFCRMGLNKDLVAGIVSANYEKQWLSIAPTDSYFTPPLHICDKLVDEGLANFVLFETNSPKKRRAKATEESASAEEEIPGIPESAETGATENLPNASDCSVGARVPSPVERVVSDPRTPPPGARMVSPLPPLIPPQLSPPIPSQISPQIESLPNKQVHGNSLPINSGAPASNLLVDVSPPPNISLNETPSLQPTVPQPQLSPGRAKIQDMFHNNAAMEDEDLKRNSLVCELLLHHPQISLIAKTHPQYALQVAVSLASQFLESQKLSNSNTLPCTSSLFSDPVLPLPTEMNLNPNPNPNPSATPVVNSLPPGLNPVPRFSPPLIAPQTSPVPPLIAPTSPMLRPVRPTLNPVAPDVRPVTNTTKEIRIRRPNIALRLPAPLDNEDDEETSVGSPRKWPEARVNSTKGAIKRDVPNNVVKNLDERMKKVTFAEIETEVKIGDVKPVAGGKGIKKIEVAGKQIHIIHYNSQACVYADEFIHFFTPFSCKAFVDKVIVLKNINFRYLVIGRQDNEEIFRELDKFKFFGEENTSDFISLIPVEVIPYFMKQLNLSDNDELINKLCEFTCLRRSHC